MDDTIVFRINEQQEQDLSPNYRLRLLRLRTIANGYEPLRAIGKQPKADEWRTRPITPEGIVEETIAFPYCINTGLRTGKLVGIDIDLVDPSQAGEVAGIVESEFGITPLVRFGSKGAMLCYYNETPARKITVREIISVERKLAGDKAQGVEFLGQGQQLIGFGIHPKIHKPYEWAEPEQTPEWIKVWDLPKVNTEQLLAGAHKVRDYLLGLGYTMAPVSMAKEVGEARIGLSGQSTNSGAGYTGRVDSPMVEGQARSGLSIDANEITQLFLDLLPRCGRRNGWYNFHCPMCGDSSRDGKGGFMVMPDGGWRYKCFRDTCDYNETSGTTGWSPGRNLGEREKTLFRGLGGDPASLPRVIRSPIWELEGIETIQKMLREFSTNKNGDC